jgi:transcriptional regulator with XRE-family HTH domain
MRRMTTESPSSQSSFGVLLRRWRRNRGLSQSGFGDLLDPKARHSTVSCWENGIRRPSWKYLGQIVAITGIPAQLALGVHSASLSGANVGSGILRKEQLYE